jgi:thiamine-phosphate diphosphorylase
LVARRPAGTTDQLASLAARFVANAGPPMAAVLITGRIDVALATGAHGVILRANDLDVATVRAVSREAAGRQGRAESPDAMLILRSVHSEAEGARAIDDGADALIAGPIWETPTHPGRPAMGTPFLDRIVSLGAPTFAVGGVTPERAKLVQAAGGWGLAAISAIWDADKPYQVAIGLLQPWIGS